MAFSDHCLFSWSKAFLESRIHPQPAFLPQNHVSCHWTPEFPAKMGLSPFPEPDHTSSLALPSKTRQHQWREHPYVQRMANRGLFVRTRIALIHIGWGIQTHAHESPCCTGQSQSETKWGSQSVDWQAASPMLPRPRVELDLLSYFEGILVKVGEQKIFYVTVC